MLPRPARIVRQAALCSRATRAAPSIKSTSTSPISWSRRNLATQAGQVRVVRDRPSPELDDSFRELIREGDMGMGLRRSALSEGDGAPPAGGKRRAKEARTAGAGSSSHLADLEVVERLSTHTDPILLDQGVGRSNQPVDHESMVPEEEEEEYAREERRSPAAVLGSKRIGVVVLPEEMKSGIQKQIDLLEDPRVLRESYLSLPSSSKSREPKHSHRSGKPRKSTESELAKAAAVMPGEYGVVRNVLEEMERRLGRDWLACASAQPNQEGLRTENRESGVEVVEFSSGLGAGMWATLDALNALPSSSRSDDIQEKLKVQLVLSSRHGLDLAAKIAEGVPERSTQLTFNRKHVASAVPPALVLSTFQLSKLPTRPAQQTHLLQLLSLESPYLILIDRSNPLGWQAISSARSFILEQSTSENPLHVVAPCPHDGVCPLVGTRDTCGFSQRLQRPSFLRKTKHSGRGEEDVGYSYLVIARGVRPKSNAASTVDGQIGSQPLQPSDLHIAGRLGGVGKEAIQRAALKRNAQSVLAEVEGAEGVLEVVHLSASGEGIDHADAAESPTSVDQAALEKSLREEAYTWPRMVAPAMKRSGHVTIDACCPDGNIQRLTFSKSQSRQAYHDARKSSWGDLFPHEPKAKPVIRTRGVRRLSKPEKANEGEDSMLVEEIMAGQAEDQQEVLKELEKLGLKVPRAEIVSNVQEGSGPRDDVTVWKSNASLLQSGQRRGFTTVAGLGTSLPSLVPGHRVQKRHMSAHPSASPQYLASPRPKVTLAELYRLKASGSPVTCLTAYDFPTASLSESCGVDMVLVGDSLSQVALGHTSTTQITLEEMIHHAKAVTRGAKTPFIFADMPFGSFEASLDKGVENTLRMIKDGGVDGVKIEGGREILPLVKRLSEIGIPVMPHLGLQPQRATSLSGYLVQGKTAEAAYDLLQTAKAMKAAGAFGLLIEAIPSGVARVVTEHTGLITIGIGAGPKTAGQVLVVTDVLGTYMDDPVVLEPETANSTISTSTSDIPIPSVAPIPTSSSTASVSASVLPPSPFTPPPQSQLTLPTPTKPASAPKFVRPFGALGPYARLTVRAYVEAVKSGQFPDSKKESYGMKRDEWERFLELVEG